MTFINTCIEDKVRVIIRSTLSVSIVNFIGLTCVLKQHYMFCRGFTRLTQITIIHWANVDVIFSVLLTNYVDHSAHRLNVICQLLV